MKKLARPRISLCTTLVAIITTFRMASAAPPAQTGTFIATGSMSTARSGHTATELAPPFAGLVLIAGGMDNTGSALATAELYNSFTRTFSPAGNMTTTRVGHTATLLADGSVLLAAGNPELSSTGVATAELYDPLSNTFSAVGNLVAPRTLGGFSATRLLDGRVLFAGGFFADPITSAELYDPSAADFTATGSMTDRRFEHTATLLANGQVLLVGGFFPQRTALNTAELYDPSSGTFTPTGNIANPFGRFSQAATLLTRGPLQGKVLLAGGVCKCAPPGFGLGATATAELYDPLTGAFSNTGSLTEALIGVVGVPLTRGVLNGMVLVIGSTPAGPFSLDSIPPTVANLYDPGAGAFIGAGNLTSFRTTGFLSTPLYAAAPITTGPLNGAILIAGGGTNSAELFIP